MGDNFGAARNRLEANTMNDPRAEFIDWDEGRDIPNPFYVEAEPCE